MPRRTLVLVLLVVALAAGAGAVLVRERRAEQRRDPVPLDIPAAEQLARRACSLFGTFERQIDENANGAAVLATLAEVQVSATAAAERDPRWRSLASGADALEVALRKDDAAAARVGIDVTRFQCSDLA